MHLSVCIYIPTIYKWVHTVVSKRPAIMIQKRYNQFKLGIKNLLNVVAEIKRASLSTEVGKRPI